MAESTLVEVDDQLYSQDDVNCLVENMYFEARSDGYAGMYATSMVVMNRVMDDRYPNTVCEVVKQGPVRESWKTRDNPNIKNENRVFYLRTTNLVGIAMVKKTICTMKIQLRLQQRLHTSYLVTLQRMV